VGQSYAYSACLLCYNSVINTLPDAVEGLRMPASSVLSTCGHYLCLAIADSCFALPVPFDLQTLALPCHCPLNNCGDAAWLA
jgi:hypothetical protein